MAKDEYCILEIICLRSKCQATGRPRVIRPQDTDGPVWEKLVEEAEKNAKNFTIVRDLVQSAADTGKDYEKIPTGRLFSMKRELVAEIAEYYGIKDEGQRRSVLVDQIKAEREAQAQIQGRMDENES